MKIQSNKRNTTTMEKHFHNIKKSFVLGALVALGLLLFQNHECYCDDDNSSDEKLLQQYIQSKGAGIISFDASNIKQFWIDKSVVSKENKIEVLLVDTQEKKKSIPLKIQLANVKATQDCKVEVIAEEKDLEFFVLDSNLKTISTSSPEEGFLQYNIISSTFCLENTNILSFFLQFNSNSLDSLNIRRIILSFSDNKDFLPSPGQLTVTGDDITITAGWNKKVDKNNGFFSVSGKSLVRFFSKKRILVSDNPVSAHVTAKNVGNTSAKLILGYAPYTVDGQNIHNRNNPYKNNIILNVLSSEANSNRIIVDSFPDWEKGCYLVSNAKEDFSDFPNFSFLEGSIDEVKEITDKQVEITLDKPQKNAVKKGSKLRVQSKYGGTYLYTYEKTLNPGEEVSFSSEIRKDESFLKYSPSAFCRGTFYVIPVIQTFSINSDAEHTIQIRDWSISF